MAQDPLSDLPATTPAAGLAAPGDLTAAARTTLHEWVASDSLRKHCEAVAACMGHFARRAGADEDRWVAVGLLHDLDYERYPDLDRGEESHPLVGVRYLREHGWDEEICRAILSHAEETGVAPVTPLERTLRAVDELSGFVTAVALVRGDAGIHAVEVSSVKKKLKAKAFAAKVNREDIAAGAALVGMPLDEVIAEVLAALRGEADRLGLAGAPPADPT